MYQAIQFFTARAKLGMLGDMMLTAVNSKKLGCRDILHQSPIHPEKNTQYPHI